MKNLLNKAIIKVFFILVLLSFLLTACNTTSSPPTIKNENTTETALNSIDITKVEPLFSIPESQQSVEASLYFRFQNQPALAGESRFIEASINESLEKKVIDALLTGPSSATTELSSLFPDQTQVVNTISQGDTLLITFNSALLNFYSDEPENWQTDPYWRKEVPMRRKLAMNSLVATICESFRYQKIQILVEPTDESTSSMRMQNSYYLDSSLPNGTAAPLVYNSQYLLTPGLTADYILSAWKNRDWESLYPFISMKDHWDQSIKPNYEQICRQLALSDTVIDYTLSFVSSSENGMYSFFAFTCQSQSSPEELPKNNNTIFRLIRENG
ncbi:MAG: GerMN domain-containing protein, partial [Clostridiales bacterium]|nr:GerMN domain-containing protein [Clostridiales bacterium]